MRFALFALLFVSLSLFLFQDVNAFTVGNLLPSYICGPTDLNLNPLDGLPKSLGGWLPNVMRLTNPLVNGTAAVATVRVDFATDQGTIANTQGLITNWHNRATIVPCQKTIFTTTALTKTATITNQIVPGQNHTLTLTINGKDGNPLCDVNTAASQETATDIANIALDGAVVFAMDANAARVGTFLAFGANENQVTTMQAWAACGANNLGIVHNQLISGTGQYTGIIWQAPATLVPGTTLTFLGAAVSDVGFGKHISGIPVISPATAAAAGATLNVATPVITKVAEAGKNLAVFFNSQANNAPAANALIIPTKFTVTATSGATTKTVTVPAHNAQTMPAALIPITADMKGQTFTVTVTASNNQAKVLPTTSAPFVFKLPAGQVQAFVGLDVVLGLCPADLQKERTMFNQDLDPDYQCAYQSQVLVQNGTVALFNVTNVVISAAQSVHPSPVLTMRLSVLFAVILAAFARNF